MCLCCCCCCPFQGHVLFVLSKCLCGVELCIVLQKLFLESLCLCCCGCCKVLICWWRPLQKTSSFFSGLCQCLNLGAQAFRTGKAGFLWDFWLIVLSPECLCTNCGNLASPCAVVAVAAVVVTHLEVWMASGSTELWVSFF